MSDDDHSILMEVCRGVRVSGERLRERRSQFSRRCCPRNKLLFGSKPLPPPHVMLMHFTGKAAELSRRMDNNAKS